MGTLNRFYGWVPHLARDFRVVRVDVRGHGASEPGEIARIDHERLARDVVELLDHLGVARAHVAGASSGAMTAAQTALRFPDRVASLGLYSFTPGLRMQQVTQGQWAEQIRAVGVSAFLRRTIEERIDTSTAPPGLVEWMLQDSAATRADLMLHFPVMLARDRFDDDLPRIACPSLMVASDGDPRYKVEEYERVCASIPGCRLIVYPGLRHNIASQAPDRCAQDLKAFLAALG
jgi:pimeloyl-ACP methyl ester carboxylesterase